MATPRAKFWRAVGETAWRDIQTDAPPAPPTQVDWLDRKWNPVSRRPETESAYRNRAQRGPEPSFRAPQLP